MQWGCVTLYPEMVHFLKPDAVFHLSEWSSDGRVYISITVEAS